MSISRKALCVVYGLIALLALVGTWGNNVAYLSLGFVGANTAFWQETLANPASRSITVDLFFLGLAVFVWMVLEARRLGMRGVWLYLLFGMLLINRERALVQRESSGVAGTLSVFDIAGLAAVTVAIAAYTVVTLS